MAHTKKIERAPHAARRSKAAPAPALRAPTPPMAWRSARSEPAGSRIERQIKKAILAGQFHAGDYLGSESELAASLGVSRLPVREAVGRLQALGLVEVKTGAGGGVRVAAGKPDHIAEIVAIQLVLDGLDAEQVLVAQGIVEVAAVGMAAKNASSAELALMRSALDEVEGLVEHPEAFTAASMAFHAAIGVASQNRFLSIMMQAIAIALERVNAPDTTVEIARMVAGRHRQLLHAIEAGDEAGSIALITRHLEQVHGHVLARLAANSTPKSGSRHPGISKDPAVGRRPSGRNRSADG